MGFIEKNVSEAVEKGTHSLQIFYYFFVIKPMQNTSFHTLSNNTQVPNE